MFPLTFAMALGMVLAQGGTDYAGAAQDLSSDAWVATDGLGRSLPVATEVGPPRTSRSVGVFYFLWLGQSGDVGPFEPR